MSKKHVAELKRARNGVESGDETYLCNALRREGEVLHRKTADEIIEQIDRDLDGCYTLNGWIEKRVRGLILSNLNEFKAKKLRATRLAWIDALIEYWKDKP